MKRTLAALVLAALLALLCFGCGPARPTNAPAATVALTESEDRSTLEPDQTEPAEMESATDAETTTVEGESTGETTTGAPVAISAPVGGSAAQIAAFYNQYASAVKAADKITIKKHDVRTNNMEVPAVLKALMPSGAGDFNPDKNETVTETFVKGKGTKDAARKLNDFLPVTGKPYVARLQGAHIKSASCAAQGDGWVVKIALKDEPLDMSAMQGQGQDMTDAQREKLMDDYMAKSGYGSSMDMGFRACRPRGCSVFAATRLNCWNAQTAHRAHVKGGLAVIDFLVNILTHIPLVGGLFSIVLGGLFSFIISGLTSIVNFISIII